MINMQCIVKNLLINYRKSGEGPVALLLHGWGTSHKDLDGVFTELQDKFTVVSLDLPGFGSSQCPDKAWSVGDYVAFVADFLKKLGLPHPQVLIGHSFGGRVIIKGVSSKIFEPKKVILIGSAGVKHSDSMRNKMYRLVAKTGKTVLTVPLLSRYASSAKAVLYKKAGSEDYLKSGVMKDTFLAVISEDLSEDATYNNYSTLLIWGSEDKEAPLSDGEYYHKVMKNSELKVVQGAGHFVHNEYKIQVNEWINDFLA